MSGWLERLFLGRETTRKLDEAQKRIKRSEKKEQEIATTEEKQLQAIHDLCSTLRSQMVEQSQRPISVVRTTTVPDLEGV